MAGLAGQSHQTTTTQAVFIPELWEDMTVAAYKANLVAAASITRFDHTGKKGDTLHLQVPARQSANDKTANNPVTLNTDTATDLTIVIDKHKEWSMVFEDIAKIQSMPSAMEFYVDDGGYAIATAIDTDVLALGAGAQGGTAYSAAVAAGDGTTAWDGSASTNTGNGSAITDAGIRKVQQTLDDVNVPINGRCLIVPPVAKNTLLGIDRFNSQDYVNHQPVATGQFGEIYGFPVKQSTNCVTLTADDTTTTYRVGVFLHRAAWAIAEQLGIRTQSSYIQEFLGDLYTADTIYGVKEIRDTSAVCMVMPS